MTKAHDMTIHMIGHGHIDPTWLWRWTEGFEEVRATFRSALDRMNETPDFHFTASSACFYTWVEACDPAMFEEIRARVAEGRWEIAGGWWIEPDCNVPCGESFVRQGLYAQRFFQRAFGKTARVGFNPDSFGHAGALPQILKKLGLDYYVYMRPQPVHEMEYPEGTTFWWEGPDGSRVLASNIPVSYNADAETSERIQQLATYAHLNPGQRHVLGFYGVGNHGGGPTKRAIRQIQATAEAPDMPRPRLSTLEAYFAALEAEGQLDDMPVIRNELQHHARGCYSAHAGVKRLNRRVEHALMDAERLAAVAHLQGHRPYPREALAEGWRNLLYNQFHDILAGTSIAPSYEDTRDQLGAARHGADRIRNLAIQSLAREIDTRAEGNTLVVFNPLPWAIREPVTVSPIVERTLDKPLRLVDDKEQDVALQAVRGDQVGAARYAFTAEAPPLGYRVYHVRGGKSTGGEGVSASTEALENRWWRITFDPESGRMDALLDKETGVPVLKAGNVLACLEDPSDTWSHGVRQYDREAGCFGAARLKVAESGPVLGRVRAVSRFGDSTAITETTLYDDLPYIDCHFLVNWQEQYRALKLAFKTCITDGVATFETPYGQQARPASGEEEPGQQWFDLSGTVAGKRYGLSILNDGQYGFDVQDKVMRLTLLRSPAYAHHDPAPFEEGRGYTIMDQGWHEVRVRLLPHAGPLNIARTTKAAWAFNAPPAVHHESAHDGTRPASMTFLSMDVENVMVAVVKGSEDGGDLVIRMRECAGTACRACLSIAGAPAAFPLHFSPFEIKTVRVATGAWTCREVNLLEN